MRIKLDIPFSLSELIISVPCSPVTAILNDISVSHICTDSRLIEKGDLFVAIKGKCFDGNRFVDEANKKGAISIGEEDTNATIKVKNSNQTLLDLAKFYKSNFPNLKATVAITGSVGKTSTKVFLHKILKNNYIVQASEKNYNNFIGLSYTIFSLKESTEYLITELGMNHIGEISSLSKCVCPDISIITNIGTSHIGFLGSKANIAKAKCEIKDGMKGGKIIIPHDELLLNTLSNSVKVAYNSDANYSFFKTSDNVYAYKHPNGIIDNLSLNVPSEHMRKNIAMAITAAMLMGVSDDNIREGVACISESDTRRRFIKLSDFTILDDSYNASYESLLADLDFISKEFEQPLGIFLGDINELGALTEDIYRKIGRTIALYNISNLYLIGNCSISVADGAILGGLDKSKIHINPIPSDSEKSINQIQSHHLNNELILFKASHSLRLDKIADKIADKERNGNDR